jgi:hypothetical protein
MGPKEGGGRKGKRKRVQVQGKRPHGKRPARENVTVVAAVTAMMLHEKGRANAARARWPLADPAVRNAAIQRVQTACAGFSGPRCARVIATALIDGNSDMFWSSVVALDTKDQEICDIWSAVCRKTPEPFQPDVAACIAGAFVRAGMPLSPPFAPRHAEWIKENKTDEKEQDGDRAFMDKRVDPPFFTAVRFAPSMAHAMLDLPLECGLDVNTPISDPLSFEADSGPAIGATNYSEHDCTTLFDRLLLRTDRSVVSAGSVYVNQSCIAQYYKASTHVLVRAILRSQFPVGGHALFLRVRLFVDGAHSDGGGTDLTGGIANRAVVLTEDLDAYGPTPQQMWPGGQFHGATFLADTIWRWWSRTPQNGVREEELAAVLARLVLVRNYLVTGMRRIKAYRQHLLPATAKPLFDGNIRERGLYTLVLSYVIVPLHDESQLANPLLD